MALSRPTKAARPPRVALPCDPVTAAAAARAEAWFRSEIHLAWIRTKPCLCCGRSSHVAAAHISKGTDGAKAVKPSDIFTVPLCDAYLGSWAFDGCHQRQHSLGEVTFWTPAGGVALVVTKALDLAMQSPCPKTRAAAANQLAHGDWRGLAA